MMIRRFIRLILEAFTVWNAINAGRLASSIAFFGLLSLAPMLIMVVGITTRLLPVDQQTLLTELLDGLLGSQAASAAENIMQQAALNTSGLLIELISLGMFLWSATTLFSLLKLSLDEIWAIPSGRSGLINLVRRKMIALITVLCMGLLLTAVLGISVALNREAMASPDAAAQAGTTTVDLLISFLGLSVVAAVTFKFLPDFHLTWRDVAGGAAITALATMVAKTPLQLYFSRMATNSPTGMASTVFVVLFFIYVMALIFFYGASFVRVFAHNYGSQRGQSYKLPNQA